MSLMETATARIATGAERRVRLGPIKIFIRPSPLVPSIQTQRGGFSLGGEGEGVFLVVWVFPVEIVAGVLVPFRND